jgi:hypothetical protein
VGEFLYVAVAFDAAHVPMKAAGEKVLVDAVVVPHAVFVDAPDEPVFVALQAGFPAVCGRRRTCSQKKKKGGERKGDDPQNWG